MSAQIICKFHKDPIKMKGLCPEKCYLWHFGNHQGQITPKWLVWSGQNSNSSEIICLSWLPASLIKIWSIINVLAWRHHFSIIVYEKIFQRSRAHNTKVTDPIRPEFKLVRDLMPVLVTSKFDEHPIKNERTSLESPFPHYSIWELFQMLTGT